MSQGYYGRNDASSAGASLAAVREELNLTVADVARHLKLTPAQVEALEEGAYERLPGRVFVRGFLRNYAKLLGVDPQPLLRRIEHEMPQPRAVEEAPPAPEAVMPTGAPSRFPLYAGVIAIIVAALAAYEFGFNAPPKSKSDAATGTAPAEQASTPASGEASARQDSAESAPSDPGSAPAQTGARGAQIAAGAPLDPAISAAGQAAAPRAAERGERELHFRFEIESWVEIRDRNDKVIFSRLNKPGSEERVTGTPPLKLVVGNARGVRLNYDNRPVDLTPYIGVTVARLTLE